MATLKILIVLGFVLFVTSGCAHQHRRQPTKSMVTFEEKPSAFIRALSRGLVTFSEAVASNPTTTGVATNSPGEVRCIGAAKEASIHTGCR